MTDSDGRMFLQGGTRWFLARPWWVEMVDKKSVSVEELRLDPAVHLDNHHTFYKKT